MLSLLYSFLFYYFKPLKGKVALCGTKLNLIKMKKSILIFLIYMNRYDLRFQYTVNMKSFKKWFIRNIHNIIWNQREVRAAAAVKRASDTRMIEEDLDRMLDIEEDRDRMLYDELFDYD